MSARLAPSPRRARQRGASALEFSLLFLIFFAVLYAIIGYAMTLLIQQGLTQAAAEGARAAVRVNPMRFASVATYQAAAETLARDAAMTALQWLPAKAKTKVTGPGGFTTSWTTGTRSIPTGGAAPITITTRTLTVTVSYTQYATDPLIPTLSIPGIGPVPSLPVNLSGKASIQLQL